MHMIFRNSLLLSCIRARLLKESDDENTNSGRWPGPWLS